jgi:hypothetical protein
MTTQKDESNLARLVQLAENLSSDDVSALLVRAIELTVTETQRNQQVPSELPRGGSQRD